MKFGIFGIVLIIIHFLLNSKVDNFEPIIDTDTFDRIYTLKPIIKISSIISFLFFSFIGYKSIPEYLKVNNKMGLVIMSVLCFLFFMFLIYAHTTKVIIPYSKDRIIYKFLFFQKTILYKNIKKISEFKFPNGNELKIIGEKKSLKFNSNFIGYYDLRSELSVFSKIKIVQIKK